MKDKEKQIEEMAKILRNIRVAQGYTSFKCDISCENCPSKQYYCVEYKYAETLYNAGYRKVPDGAVIIPAEERDGEMKAYNEERAEFEKEIERLKIQLEQANAGIVNCSGCKLVEINAVREFAEKVKEKALSHCRTINCYELTFIETTIDELKEYEK